MAYWNNDYDKITEYYVKLVKKYLNSISEENIVPVDSNNKVTNINNPNITTNTNNKINKSINNNGNVQIENKENKNNNILKSLETNADKLKINLNLDKISSNAEQNDNRCLTERETNKNSNKDIRINKNEEAQTLQNGGTIISTIYDENINMVSKKSYKEKINVRPNYSMDLDESEEPTQQKINESYKPKLTIQGFLQTDANNIKMNARLIKEKNKLNEIKNKFNEKPKELKSEESNNISDINNTINNNINKNYNDIKETENHSEINRIPLT
jgi:hypothetical protein